MTNVEFMELKKDDIIKRKNTKDNSIVMYIILEDYREGSSYIYTDKKTISTTEHNDYSIANMFDLFSISISSDDNWLYLGSTCIHRADLISFEVTRNEYAETRFDKIMYNIKLHVARHNELNEISFLHERPIGVSFKEYPTYKDERLAIMKYISKLSKHNKSTYNDLLNNNEDNDHYL